MKKKELKGIIKPCLQKESKWFPYVLEFTEKIKGKTISKNIWQIEKKINTHINTKYTNHAQLDLVIYKQQKLTIHSSGS